MSHACDSPLLTLPAPSVALYWDFENLHAALVEERHGDGAYAKPDARFKVQEPLVDVAAVVELATRHGALAIHRAYANWQYLGRYRDALLQSAIDLVQMFPPGGAAKNGADIRLCLDAADDVARLAHVRTVVVVGGDSDFMPLAQRLKAAGRVVVGVGSRRHTNRHWARACHAFHYYDELAATAATTAMAQAGPSAPGPISSEAPQATHAGHGDDPDATVTLPAPIVDLSAAG